MDFIISLAHFCEVHGPQPVLCTQLSPISCATCEPSTTPQSEDLPRSSSFPGNKACWNTPSESRSVRPPQLLSPFETPPNSPSSARGAHNPYFPSIPSDTDISRYSSGSESESDACDNCTFLVPKDVSERLPDGAPGSPTKDGKGRHGSPVLRTCQSIVAQGSPVQSDDDLDSMGGSFVTKHPNFSTNLTPTPPSLPNSTASSPLYPPPNTHTHKLTYVTTRQPSGAAYSLLRRSCLRTLSFENLPRGSPSGPIYFGDPIAGYTIAYIFRLPDPRARGRRRTYALIAFGGRDSWRVSMAMVMITRVFESIASDIVTMADQVLERESAVHSRPSTAIPATPPDSLPKDAPARKDSGQSSSPVTRNITPVSSFLSAKKVDPDGYPRASRDVMRAKSLAEIVGKANFFVELHAKFCMILSTLYREFGT